MFGCLQWNSKSSLQTATIIFIIFWDSLMFYQLFLSPQVKRWAIITYTHCIGDLSHELPNNLRLRKLGSIRKVSKRHRITAQSPASPQPPKWKLLILAKNSGKLKLNLSNSALFHTKTEISLKYFVNDCSPKIIGMTSNNHQPVIMEYTNYEINYLLSCKLFLFFCGIHLKTFIFTERV